MANIHKVCGTASVIILYVYTIRQTATKAICVTVINLMFSAARSAEKGTISHILADI